MISTRLGPGTVHLAQVVVDPQLRRLGAGAALVRLALQHAASAGFTRATLMVDGRNQPARALYARLGFEAGERFLFGQNQPTSTTKSGVATRRSLPPTDSWVKKLWP